MLILPNHLLTIMHPMRSEILLTLLLLSTIADAILDRVVHNAHRMKLAGYGNNLIM